MNYPVYFLVEEDLGRELIDVSGHPETQLADPFRTFVFVEQ